MKGARVFYGTHEKMWRFLVLVALFCHVANAEYLAITTDGALVRLDAALYFSFGEHASDYLSLYMPTRHTCQSIIDAQYVDTDDTYRIYDWYHEAAGDTGVSVRVSIVDLAVFVEHALDAGVWTGGANCDTVWTRISTVVLRDLFLGISQPIGSPLVSASYGITGGVYCDESPCSAAQLVEILKVSPPNQLLALK